MYPPTLSQLHGWTYITAMATGGDKSRIIPHSVSKISVSKHRRRSKPHQSDSGDGSVLLDVIKKVKKLPDFKSESENVIKEAAQDFINPEHYKSLFSEFNERQFIDTASGVSDEAQAELLADGEETEVAALRSSNRLAAVCDLTVKLCLARLDVPSQYIAAKFASLLEAKYGATCAALLIGNDKHGYWSFEWTSSSLIIPKHYENPKCVFMARVPSEVNLVHHQLDGQIQAAGRRLDYNEQIDHLFEASIVKSKMLDNLIELVLQYNKYYYFHTFSRNSQHFVTHVMEAMNIKNPHNFTGRLKEYFEQVKKGLPHKPPSFCSHAELDTHIQANISGATPHDLEYFLCMYFHFHFTSRSQSENPSEWQCEVESCQMSNVEQYISHANLILNHFS